MKNCYYKFNMNSELGKAFRKVWRLCDKAERAADRFAAKVGAVTYYPVDTAFAGGVTCVAFKDNVCHKPKHWKSIGKDADGLVQYVPNVKQRHGALVLPDGDFKAGNAANRIYGKQPVRDQKGRMVLPFVELYRDDEASRSKWKPKQMSLDAKESIRIEKERLTLPTVSVMSILTLLQADMTGGKGSDGKPHIVKPVTPTFFKYSRQIYVGCAYPCHAKDLKEISMGDYLETEKEIRAMMRDLESIK